MWNSLANEKHINNKMSRRGDVNDMRPLEGIRIVDLTTSYSGPICTMQFADFGAEVIKIENTKTGDFSRTWEPMVKGRSTYYPSMNRNKKSITVNLKTDEGRQIVLDLIKNADIVVENFRPGTLQKMRLTYENMKAVKPDIILASISGYGQTGPYRSRSAYSNLAEALSGVMYLTGFPDGMPVGSGVSFGDSVGGMTAALGIMFALYHRDKTGQGQCIDVSMTDALVHLISYAIVSYTLTGNEPQRMGNRDPAAYPYDVFKAKDGNYCFLSIASVADWTPFAEACGLEYLIDDPRFDTNEHRIEHADELDKYISAWAAQHTRDEIEQIFEEHHVGFSPVLKTSELLSNEQLLARDMIVDMEDPVMGKYKMQGIAIKMSETPGEIRTTAPEMGQNNEEVLGGLGYTPEQIFKLHEEGVI